MKRAFLAAVAALYLTLPARAELDDNGEWLSGVLGAITYAEAHCHDMKINHLAMQQLMAGRGYGPKHKPEQDMVDIVVAAHRFKLGLEESPPAAVCSNLWGHFGGAGSDRANILLPDKSSYLEQELRKSYRSLAALRVGRRWRRRRF